MKLGGGVHTVPQEGGDGWVNRRDGKVLSRHKTKEVAEAAGCEIARRLEVEHVIHREEGVITEANSHGSDPCPPRDGR